MLGLIIILCGLALLLVYKMKRKTMPLILGVYMAYLGVVILAGNGLANSLFISMFFIVPGIIFMVLFFDKNKYKLLLPGMVLICFGLFLLVRGLPIISLLSTVSLLALFMAMPFFAAHCLSRGYIGKWVTVVGWGLIVVGIVTAILL